MMAETNSLWINGQEISIFSNHTHYTLQRQIEELQLKSARIYFHTHYLEEMKQCFHIDEFMGTVVWKFFLDCQANLNDKDIQTIRSYAHNFGKAEWAYIRSLSKD